MKIVDKRKKRGGTCLGDLCVGDVFSINGSDSGEVYIVSDEFDEDYENRLIVISQNDGCLHRLAFDTEVTKLRAKLVLY